jgi:hypothetical protein
LHLKKYRTIFGSKDFGQRGKGKKEKYSQDSQSADADEEKKNWEGRRNGGGRGRVYQFIPVHKRGWHINRKEMMWG